MGKIQCEVSCGDYSTETVIKVQKDAPVDMLLGTDLQHLLGFALMQLNDSEPKVNLLPLQDSATVNKGDGHVPVWAKKVEPISLDAVE